MFLDDEQIQNQDVATFISHRQKRIHIQTGAPDAPLQRHSRGAPPKSLLIRGFLVIGPQKLFVASCIRAQK
jgi:hypothetical protein